MKLFLCGVMQTEAPESMMSIEVASEMALRQVALCRVEIYPVGVFMGDVIALVRQLRWMAMMSLGS